MLIIAPSKVSEGGCSCLFLEMGAPSCESKSWLKVPQFSDDLEWTSEWVKQLWWWGWAKGWPSAEMGWTLADGCSDRSPSLGLGATGTARDSGADSRPTARSRTSRSILLSPPCDRTLLSQILWHNFSVLWQNFVVLWLKPSRLLPISGCTPCSILLCPPCDSTLLSKLLWHDFSVLWQYSVTKMLVKTIPITPKIRSHTPQHITIYARLSCAGDRISLFCDNIFVGDNISISACDRILL